MFRIDKSIQGGYVSGTELVWLGLFFIPVINTLFFLLLLKNYVFRILNIQVVLKSSTEGHGTTRIAPYVIYDGVIDELDDTIAYVRLYDVKTSDESQAEIYLTKFPAEHTPEEGLLFKIKSDGTIDYLSKKSML
jgi:hypothetical protein